MSCMILGDSLGDGLAAHMPQCQAIAHKGWSSTHWRDAYGTMRIDADRVVISLGSNDFGIDTAHQLRLIRAQVKARRVIWIVPARNAGPVLAVATEHGDAVMPITRLSRDHIHPTTRAYGQMARRLEGDA